jgi:hypothetical protein
MGMPPPQPGSPGPAGPRSKASEVTCIGRSYLDMPVGCYIDPVYGGTVTRCRGVVNIAIHWEYSPGIVFIFP